MNIAEYFEREDTPSTDSPVGTLMVRVLAKNPQMDFEQARQEVHNLLERAARGKVYRIPTVYTLAQLATRKAQMVAAFKKSKETTQKAA